MKIIPLGERLLVKRCKVGEKIGKEGQFFASESTANAPTDLADVVHIPELTFGDKKILDNAEKIVGRMTVKASEGDSEALIALLRLNEFIKIKSIKEGDKVMISRYVGVTFTGKDSSEELTLVNGSDIIGMVRE